MGRRRRQERLARRARLKGEPGAVVPRLQPITHREGSPTLAPAVQAAPRPGAGVGRGAAGAAAKKRVSPAATLSHMTQLIMPQYANSLGITFGGQARAACAPLERAAGFLCSCHDVSGTGSDYRAQRRLVDD